LPFLYIGQYKNTLDFGVKSMYPVGN